MATQSAPAQRQQLDLATLNAQQLLQVKKQLDDELEHLNASFTQLRSAQAKFVECLRCLEGGGGGLGGRTKDAPILVPLTTSLYVPGTIASVESVMVDVGTGFYVEKTIPEASTFYNSKSKELGKNLKDLENILQGKSNNLRMVEDVLRQKVMEDQQRPPAAQQVGA